MSCSERNQVEEIGELVAYSIRRIAHDIKSKWMLEDDDFSEENDVELVRDDLSIEGINISGGYFYLFCRESRLFQHLALSHLWRLERLTLCGI